MKQRVLSMYLTVMSLAVALIACEKKITVDLPSLPEQIVVEGSIEQGQPPIVLLTRTQGYFDPIDLNAFSELFVSGATVTVANGTTSVVLDEICSSNIPEEFLPLVAEATGLTPAQLAAFDICIYSTFNTSIWGEANRVYTLEVEYQQHRLRSSTKINSPIALDSVWFEIPGTDPNNDSLGFAYAILQDPDTLGNAYRWFARRINTYPAWSAHAGDVKDPRYIAPLGSATDDAFFNGLTFEFSYFRGDLPNSQKEDDTNEESGFFKVGDTIAVRATVIDRAAMNYIRSFENQAGSSGTPFASPANIQTNIEGGLGAWIGYGAVYDTIYCVITD